MTSKAPAPTVKANDRQLLEYLRSGDWKLLGKVPVGASPKTLKRIVDYGWIELRGTGPRLEIKLTAAGLVALKTPL